MNFQDFLDACQTVAGDGVNPIFGLASVTLGLGVHFAKGLPVTLDTMPRIIVCCNDCFRYFSVFESDYVLNGYWAFCPYCDGTEACHCPACVPSPVFVLALENEN